MNLNQVTLPARNIAESVSFYRKLGLIQIVDSEHYARFECPDGDATFSIDKAEESDISAGAVIYFEHAELDALCARLENDGIEFIQMPQDESWLWREARLNPNVSPLRSAARSAALCFRLVFARLRDFLPDRTSKCRGAQGLARAARSEIPKLIPLTQKIPQPIKSARLLQLMKHSG